MANSVTVLGASGSTVTIPFTSSANAAAAQSALGMISGAVASNFMKVYLYPGTGTVPAQSPAGAVEISGSTGVNLGNLPLGTYAVLNNLTDGVATVASATNEVTVVSGNNGLVFINNSDAAEIFLAGGTNVITENRSTANAVVNTENGITLVESQVGASTVNAFGDGTVLLKTVGESSAVVNAYGNNTVKVIGAAGENAVSVFGAGSGNYLSFIGNSSAVSYINPGADNITVASGSGRITLVGGSGNAVVMQGQGSIDGGTGTNYLSTDGTAGATTLTSSGINDTLVGQGAGNMYIVNGTNELITDQSSATSSGGAIYQVVGGSATIYGSAAANSRFNLGGGDVTIFGQHGADGTRGNVYTDAFNVANSITINDFVQGQDVFWLSGSSSEATLASLNYYSDSSTSPFGRSGTEAILSDGTKIDFLGVNVTNSAFT